MVWTDRVLTAERALGSCQQVQPHGPPSVLEPLLPGLQTHPRAQRSLAVTPVTPVTTAALVALKHTMVKLNTNNNSMAGKLF